jgi:hypothetical protein
MLIPDQDINIFRYITLLCIKFCSITARFLHILIFNFVFLQLSL